MIKILFLFFVSPLVFDCLMSCKISKQLPYFKDLPDTAAVTRIATTTYQPLKLQADDEVQITISNPSPEASQFFNMASASPLTTVAGASLPGGATGTTGSIGVMGTGNTSVTAQNVMNLYRVSSGGLITLPILKDIKAAGLTTDELKTEILNRLQPYLKDPVVMIRLTNFKVTVIGEVLRPVVVPVNGQTINVLEAIGAAGDMTVFGIRRNVKVIRRLPDGTTEVALLDFNKAKTLQSPYFQLKQNDIVYVQPHKNRSIAASQTGIWVSIFAAIASITAIILTRTN
jgi:polysaccharide biosynthesis/export protein